MTTVRKLEIGTVRHNRRVTALPVNYWVETECLDCGHVKRVRLDCFKNYSCGNCCNKDHRTRNDHTVALLQVWHGYRLGAVNRNHAFDLDMNGFYELSQQDCYFCGAEPGSVAWPCSGKRTPERKFIYNGVDRLDNNLGYVEGNMVPCCKMCNQMKSNYDMDEWLDHVMRITDHQRGES